MRVDDGLMSVGGTVEKGDELSTHQRWPHPPEDDSVYSNEDD